MENITPTTEKMTTTEKVVAGLVITALASFTFIGTRILVKKFKEKTQKKSIHDNENETNPDLDFEDTPQNHTKSPAHNSLPPVRLNPSFPLKVGDKGDVIFRLQTALIKSFGAGIFKKFGADGQFGNELDTFLRSKNYSVPLSQANYTTLTQEKKEEIVNTNLPLNAFNPTAVAYSIYNALLTKDFLSVITILKGITSSSQYALASEEFKKYRIQGGVRQTIVTALFNSFKTINQKIVIQDALKKIGLKFDGNKWTL